MTVLDRFSLAGKVAIVTGASSGLGVAFAQALAEAGADVAVGARRLERLSATASLVEAAGQRVLTARTDVTLPEDCTALVEATMDAFGRVDILVNNAGVGTAVPATRETTEQFRSLYDVNVFGAYWMAQACGRVMQPGASIINVSSVLGMRSFGLPQAAYTSSKAALIGLTRDLSQQWVGRKGIRFNALAPGIFPSEMTDEFTPEIVAGVVAQTPMGRVGDVSELAASLVFLASDAASYITGVTLPVDGGWLAP
jgi:NAD(P)-dependent dehydrogenase (short-subunit alcohol dehydrogenase family)